MAFNPFEAFRKNSKALLALLTIFIMFVFILSSGIGGGMDFFDWLARQFGGTDRRGAVMGEIDGHEYYHQELYDIRQDRSAANVFMIAAVTACDNQLIAQIDQDLKNNLIRSPQIRGWLENVPRDRASILQFGGAIQFEGGQIQQMSAEQLSARMLTTANNPELNERDNAAEIRNLRRAARVFDHAATLFAFARSGLFFGEIGNQNNEEALRFLMILKEADKLGIQFSDEDIKKLIAEESDNVLNDEKIAQEVDSVVRQRHKISQGKLITAINNEYRMRTALQIMHGTRTSPAAMTPFEMWEYYNDKFTQIRFETVDVNIEKYIALVTGEPTRQELAVLYDSYARTEYDPAKSTPGFKEPRKIKIQFVGVDDTLPAYKSAASIINATTAATFPLQAISGSDPFSGALFAATPFVAEPLLMREGMERDPLISVVRQDEIIKRVRHGLPDVPVLPGLFPSEDTVRLIRLYQFLSNRFLDPYPVPSDQLLYQPLPLAALTGQLATASNPLAATASAVGAMRNSTLLLDARARVAAGIQAVIAPLPSNAAFPFTSSIAALANLPTLPEPFWIAMYRERLAQNKVMERRFALRDFERLEERLNEIRKKLQPPEEKKEDPKQLAGKKKEPFKPKKEDIDKANADARALIEQFIKERTIKGQPSVVTGQSEQLRDQFSIHTDPGLKTLTSLFFDPKPYTRYQNSFFGGFDPKDNLDAGLYTPVIFPDGSVSEASFKGKTYLAWRIEDLPPKQVPYDKASDEMKAQVVRAWKIQKARVLAEEDAKQLAEQLKALAQKNLINADNLPAFENEMIEMVRKNDKWQKLIVPIELQFLRDDPHRPPTMPGQPESRPSFVLPTIRNADIQYPLSSPPDRNDPFASRDPWNGQRMALQLLEARAKPLGETVTVPDTPNMHLYVCVLVHKTPPSIDSFYQVFRLSRAPIAQNRNPFDQPRDLYYGPLMMETRVNQTRDMFERVKADVKYKETEELKKSLEKGSE